MERLCYYVTIKRRQRRSVGAFQFLKPWYGRFKLPTPYRGKFGNLSNDVARQPAKTLNLTPDELGLLRRYIATATAILERYALNAEIIAGLPTHLALLEIAVRESSEDEANAIKALAARLKRLEELELLRQVGKDQSLEAKRARGSITDEHNLEHLQDMLIEITNRLQFAELKKARVGLSADYTLIAEIDELQAARAEIEMQINELRKQTRKLE